MSHRWIKKGLCMVMVVCLLPLSACANDSNSSKTDVSSASSSVTTTTSSATQSSTTTTEGVTTTAVTTIPVTTASTTITTSTTVTTEVTTSTTAVTTTTKPTEVVVPAPKEWELYWSDEFEGDSLDMSKWNIESGSTGTVVKSKDNVKVEDGNCVITLCRDNPTSDYEYSSAYVTTANKFSFCYGRLEFRAKLPTGQGVWPALWTLGDNYLTIANDEKGWPLCGEIDIMELVGCSDPQNPFDNKKIMGTLHWGANRGSHQQAHNILLLRDSPDAEYHIYAVEWNVDEIVWFVDDKEYMRVSLDDPTMGTAFMQKHWIIMNINLNGSDGFNKYNETTPDTVGMYVDYVRVYKEKK